MRFNWLESKAVSRLFFGCAIALSALFAFTCLLAIPGIPQFLNTSPVKNPLAILFGALVVVGIPSTLLLFFGMAISCASNNSSTRTKALWFALFFVTGPIGSIVYYFADYRGKTTAAELDTRVTSL